MGSEISLKATEVAILNAISYGLSSQLILLQHSLYVSNLLRVAHESQLDCRDFKANSNVTVDDIGIDGLWFHAPTMSWPL